LRRGVGNWNGTELFTFKNISATTASFTLRGGNYGVTVHATWGGGNVALQRRTADGSTFINALTAFTADGYANADLPGGTYQIAVTTATGVYVDVTSTVTSL
jgi:hypothetical protein